MFKHFCARAKSILCLQSLGRHFSPHIEPQHLPQNCFCCFIDFSYLKKKNISLTSTSCKECKHFPYPQNSSLQCVQEYTGWFESSDVYPITLVWVSVPNKVISLPQDLWFRLVSSLVVGLALNLLGCAQINSVTVGPQVRQPQFGALGFFRGV